jgi:ring-1,2-phenylacetyl-CoA epoxidase subunit PaaC
MDKTLFEYLLRLGDSSLILSQRLGAWTGHGPILEEDLALTNTALDLLGQARMWLTLAGEVEGAGRDEDALAYLRDAHQFHNALLVERPNGNYADTMARQFLFDVWHYFLLQRLEKSSDERVAGIAAKAIKEVTYHVRKAMPRCRPPSMMPGVSPVSCSPTTPSTWTSPPAASAVNCRPCASPGWPMCAKSWKKPP